MTTDIDTKLLSLLLQMADSLCDGHLTIMKFTTNWRIQLGTPVGDLREEIERMPAGKTFSDAAIAALHDDLLKHRGRIDALPQLNDLSL